MCFGENINILDLITQLTRLTFYDRVARSTRRVIFLKTCLKWHKIILCVKKT